MFRPGKLAEISNKRKLILPRISSEQGPSPFRRSVAATKGHFVVYTADGERYEVPLEYLNSPLFKELLKMSEEVFGSPGNGPIVLTCDSEFLDYIIRFIQRQSSKETGTLLILLASGCPSECRLPEQDQLDKTPPLCSC